VRGSAAPRRLELQLHLPGGVELDPLVRQRRPRDVAAQLLEPLAVGIAGFEDLPYYGLFAPAGTPKAALDTLAAALGRVIAQPEVSARLTALGLAVEFMSATQLAQREQAYTRSWAEIIRKTGFTPQ
jgi:hypothetical protein